MGKLKRQKTKIKEEINTMKNYVSRRAFNRCAAKIKALRGSVYSFQKEAAHYAILCNQLGAELTALKKLKKRA